MSAFPSVPPELSTKETTNLIEFPTGPISRTVLSPEQFGSANAEAVALYDPSVWSLIEGSQRFRERVYTALKSGIDIAGALVLSLAVLPLCVLIAVTIKLTSPGPVLFRHKRLGRHGREFWCYKFRSMMQDADLQLKQNEQLLAEFEQNYKIKSDPRITSVGAFLRRVSLDELPQFWNVLRRDMSLIGPRPIVPPELEKYGPYGSKLLSVMPGISGIWQAHGRSDTTYAQRIQMDMLYIDHRSTWLDLKLLVLTFVAVLRKTGAC